MKITSCGKSFQGIHSEYVPRRRMTGSWKYFRQAVTAQMIYRSPKCNHCPTWLQRQTTEAGQSLATFLVFEGKGFQKLHICLLSESEAISFLPPKRIWHCTEKEAAEISCWDGTYKTSPTGLQGRGGHKARNSGCQVRVSPCPGCQPKT